MAVLSRDISADDHVKGLADAPVTLVEYGDFECPYCGETVGVIDGVQRLMGERLRYVFRHFPLIEPHPHALHAAGLAEAASEIGRFWDAHRILYDNQHALDDRALRNYGRRLGLGTDTVEAALAGHYAGRIELDFQSGIASGVNATPTLFINGVRHDGRRDLRGLHAALLAAAEQRG
ncbi:DsbA family protein [Labrys sp. La1]|uniref:DsbA family protein n=1 Tax=Labrys sp. La1 TaxID=3404917 RepID=UPI003EBD6221